jgi:hypothetical protein
MNVSRIHSTMTFAGRVDDRPIDESWGAGAAEVTQQDGDRDDRVRRPLALTHAAVAAGALIAAGVGVWLPWLRVGAGGTVHLYTGTALPVIAEVMVGLPVAAVVATGVCVARRSRDAQDMATLATGAAAFLAGLLLLFVECASAVIPNGLLPATIRRYTLDLRAGPGLWIALAAAAIATAALSGRLRGGLGHPLAGRGVRLPGQRLVTLAGLGGLVVAFGFIRYGDWVQATAVGQRYGIGGWGLPWVGPLSLVAMLGLIAATAIALTGRDRPAGVLAATSGWLITLAAALAIIAADALGSVRFVTFAPASIRGYAPHLGAASGATIGFGIGIGAALLGDLMLWSAGPGTEPR